MSPRGSMTLWNGSNIPSKSLSLGDALPPPLPLPTPRPPTPLPLALAPLGPLPRRRVIAIKHTNADQSAT
jgi:hypothetical protein